MAVRVGSPPPILQRVLRTSHTLVTTDYAARVVTVPAPAISPLLGTIQAFGSGSWVNDSVYDFACTYEGWTGETMIGPIASVTIANGQGVAVLPQAALGTRAVGARVYIRKDGGVWHRGQHGIVTRPTRCGFADQTLWGGFGTAYNVSAAQPPGSNTATDQDTTVIADPILPPLTFPLGLFPNATTFYGAYTYVCEDGTETALSPISTVVTTHASLGNSISFTLRQSVPSGAVFVNLYLATTNDPAAMKRQRTNQPLGFVSHEIWEYQAAGAAPSPGAAQSTVSPLQHAIDAALELGGARVLVRGGLQAIKVPIIARGTKANGAPTGYVWLEGEAGHDINGALSPTRVTYTGALTGVELLVFSGHAWRIDNLDFEDPNSRVKYGLSFGSHGSGSATTTRFSDCAWTAFAPGGIALSVPSQSQANPSGNHTASEMYFDRCTFSGNQWAMDLHGNQTGDFRFQDCNSYCSGSALNGANQGDIRIFSGWTYFRGHNTDGNGQYFVYLSEDSGHGTRGAAYFGIELGYSEIHTAQAIIYASSMLGDPTVLSVRDSYLHRFQGPEGLALYMGCPGKATFQDNQPAGGNVFLNHADAVIHEIGTAGLEAAAFQGVATNYRYGLVPKTQPILATSATLSEVITALQGLELVRQS